MAELGITLLITVGLLAVGVPVAYAFGAGGLLFAALADRGITYLLPYAFWQIGGFALLALPLFVLAGALMATAGLSERLIAFVEAFVGRLRGGIGAATIVTCALFGAISGSGASAIAAIGPIMIPRMVKAGYPSGYATSLVACASVLALLIPPSIPMIVFALTSGIPVTACFLSTVVPGVVLTVVYCGLNYFRVRRLPAAVAAMPPWLSFREQARLIVQSTRRAALALLLPVVILGGIYSGVFTPTEAAAVAVIYTALVGVLFYRELTPRNTAVTIVEAGKTIGTIMVILLFLLMMSRVMVLEQIPRQIADLLLSVSDNHLIILLMVNFVLILIGMFVDDISGSILAAIVLTPVMNKMGIHPVHFAAIVGVNLGLGNVTPPFAPFVFIASSIGGVPADRLIGPTFRFLIFGNLPVLAAVTYFPDLALWLPRLLLGVG